MQPLKLKDGRAYVTRSGLCVDVRACDKDSPYQFWGKVWLSGLTVMYSSSGLALTSALTGDSRQFDIVSEFGGDNAGGGDAS